MARKTEFTYPRLCQLAAGIGEEDWQRVLTCLKAREFTLKRGDLLLREGDRPDRIGILLSGRLAVYRERLSGYRELYEIIEPNQSFGASYAFLGKKEMVVGVKAVEESRVIMCEALKVPSVCARPCPAHNLILKNTLAVVGQRCFRIRQKIRILSRRTTREKLMTFLHIKAKKARCNEFDIPYDRQELADFLCVDRSAMAAEISKLRRDGILTSTKNHFKLLDGK